MRAGRAWTPPHHPFERWTLPLDVGRLAPRTRLLHSIDHVAPAWGPWRSVVTVHDLAFSLFPETHTPASRSYYAATGESVRRADRVIAVSRNTADDLERLMGVEPEKIRVIHEAAAAEFTPRPRAAWVSLAASLGLDADQPYVLAVGTLEPRKNHLLLIEAFARFPAELHARLVIAGGHGESDTAVRSAIARLGLAGRARLVGPRTADELAVLYSHAAVLAYPSLYEGFGLPLLEAMACGTPVVASNSGPMQEVAGGAAVLLAPRDSETWARALAEILSAPERAERLRQQGFRRAQEFSWGRAARETLVVYREVMAA